MTNPPDYTAELPVHFDNGQLIPTTKGIWVVYSWLPQQGRWYAVLASTIEDTARSFVRDVTEDLKAKGVPCWYQVKEVK